MYIVKGDLGLLFISFDDFRRQAKQMPRLTREAEKECAATMAQGDPAARDRLIASYLPFVASVLGKAPRQIQTLNTVYCAVAALEKGIDTFDFQQDSERFSHHLSWRMRQCIARCIADQ